MWLDLTKQENMLLIVSTEHAESKPVKQETNCSVILFHTVSVLWTSSITYIADTSISIQNLKGKLIYLTILQFPIVVCYLAIICKHQYLIAVSD